MAYDRIDFTPDEHAYFSELARITAKLSTKALAEGSLRLGQAHRYLICAHIEALMEGMGENEAVEFIDLAVSELRAPMTDRQRSASEMARYRVMVARHLTQPSERPARDD